MTPDAFKNRWARYINTWDAVAFCRDVDALVASALEKAATRCEEMSLEIARSINRGTSKTQTPYGQALECAAAIRSLAPKEAL